MCFAYFKMNKFEKNPKKCIKEKSLIDSKKGIKRSELAQELDKTDMTIHRTIKKLIEFNMIRRVGSKKTG